MNYWLWVGLLFLAVGIVYYLMGRSARRRVGKLEGLSGAAVVVGYLFPPIGVVFILVGLFEAIS